MVTPGSLVTVADSEDVLQTLVDSNVRIGSNIVEECESVDMDLSFNRKFPKQEVEQRNEGEIAQLQETLQSFVLKD